MRQGNVYISCNYSYTISFLVKILLVKLKYLYIQYAWISIIKKQNSNENGKVEKMVVLVKLLFIAITSFNFCNCPVKLWRSLKLKFRSKFNHDLTNHGYLHHALWKSLYNFKKKEPMRQVINNFSFRMFKIMRSLTSSKCLKTTVHLTFTTQKANARSPWTACSVFNWKYLFWVNFLPLS